MAMLSIRGLYEWDNDIFANLHLPDGVDSETLQANILLELAELEVVYPDADIMKSAIGYWSTAMLPGWTKMYAAMTASYNPIYNKDGYMEETVESSGSSSSEGSGTSTGSVAGMNTDTLNDAEQTETSSESSGESSGTVGTERHEYGNIGVTTTQAMIREEMDLRRDYNIYDIITEDFRRKFCLLVY